MHAAHNTSRQHQQAFRYPSVATRRVRSTWYIHSLASLQYTKPGYRITKRYFMEVIQLRIVVNVLHSPPISPDLFNSLVFFFFAECFLTLIKLFPIPPTSSQRVIERRGKRRK